MKTLYDFKEDIHKCSRCGICQSVCPVYKITGNDCTVSRGYFVMLKGVLNGKLNLSETINKYLDMCLKCGKCKDVCPSGVDALDIIIASKAKYFSEHSFEKFISLFLKYFIYGLAVKIISLFIKRTKSKTFEKKVLYFGGCGSKVLGDKAVVKILNSLDIEVINPNFHCCGVYMLMRGDLDGFNKYIESFVDITKKYKIKEVVLNCATCEAILKSYQKWAKDEDIKKYLETVKFRNIFEYIRVNELKLKLKKPTEVTYHKPCHLRNYDDVKWVLNNTENLIYKEMEKYDSCCGFNGLHNHKMSKAVKQIASEKREHIIDTKAKIVLTSCLGCELVLKMFSKGRYKVDDLLKYINKNV